MPAGLEVLRVILVPGVCAGHNRQISLSQRLMRLIINENGPDLAVTRGTSRTSRAHSAHPLTAPPAPPLRRGVYCKSLMLTSASSCWKRKKGGAARLSGTLPVPGWSNSARNVRLSMGSCVRKKQRAGRKIPGHTRTHARTHKGTTA